MTGPLITYMKKCTADALLGEVSTTPKPGLVDLCDSGSHRDMDYHTFELSTAAVVPWLLSMAEEGLSWEGCAEGLFQHIRPLGVRAEQAMYAATGGVNTHKGIIFSMGILGAACGWYYRLHRRMDAAEICALCREMTYDALEKDFQAIKLRPDNTHGELLYLNQGHLGIRGEAQSGFASVMRYGLPVYLASDQTGLLGDTGSTVNDASQISCSNAFSGMIPGKVFRDYDSSCCYRSGPAENRRNLQILLNLMSHVDDTNVYARAGRNGKKASSYVKEQAGRILELGGAGTRQGMDALTALNQDFIQKNISPGGCADLLALTLFLGAVTEYKGENG